MAIMHNAPCQEYFSKRFDAGGTNFYNRLKTVIVENDTLYYSAFNVCNYSDTTATDCGTIGKMDMYGNIIAERHFDWLDPVGDTRPMCIVGDRLLVVDGSQWYDDSHIYLLILDKYSLDSIARYQYDIGEAVWFYAASAVISYRDFYIITGWCRLAAEDKWPDWMLWINKHTMEIDTILEYPFEKRAAKYEFMFTGDDGLLTIYYTGNRLVDPARSNSSRGFVKYNASMQLVFFYMDTIDLTTSISYEHAGLLQANGNMVYKQGFVQQDPWLVNGAEFEVLCVNGAGELIWRFNNPGWARYGRQWVYSLSETSDGDILGCGEIWGHFYPPLVFEYDPFDTIPDPPYYDPPLESDRYFAPYIFKLDGATGELLWQYALIEMNEYWHSGPKYLSELYELSDGSLMGGGGYAIRDPEGVQQSLDSWVVRLPPDGCLYTGSDTLLECGFESWLTGTEDIILVPIPEGKPFLLYPNPANSVVHIRPLSPGLHLHTVRIRSVDGRILYTHRWRGWQISLSSIPAGVILVELLDEKGRVMQVEKVLRL